MLPADLGSTIHSAGQKGQALESQLYPRNVSQPPHMTQSTCTLGSVPQAPPLPPEEDPQKLSLYPMSRPARPPARHPSTQHPHLCWPPPLMASFSMLPGRLWSLALPFGRLCWGIGGNQPRHYYRNPSLLGREPDSIPKLTKDFISRDRRLPRERLPRKQTSPLWAGPSAFSTPGTRGLREGS